MQVLKKCKDTSRDLEHFMWCSNRDPTRGPGPFIQKGKIRPIAKERGGGGGGGIGERKEPSKKLVNLTSCILHECAGKRIFEC